MNQFLNAELTTDRITTKAELESKTGSSFALQGTAMLSSPRLLPVEASERLFLIFNMHASDDLVPMIFISAIFISVILISAIFGSGNFIPAIRFR
jgi:hypothetical protein